jgi:hypothetical protein
MKPVPDLHSNFQYNPHVTEAEIQAAITKHSKNSAELIKGLNFSQKNKKEVIRVGDTVKIVNSDIIYRVGYLKSKECILRNHLKESDIVKIEEFIGSFGIPKNNENVFDKIADALAYGILKADHFGGNVRSIHSENKPEYLGLEGTVIDRKVVKTGTYKAGYSYIDNYWGTTEYTPTELVNQKTHVLFKVEVHRTLVDDEIGEFQTVWIENKNLEKV